MVELSILVVTYNSAHVVLDCLDAVNGMQDVEVIVYDNASSDTTVESIRDRYPAVHVIEGSDNAGFAVGVNRAAAKASGSKIMLLNPDAVIYPPSVWTLMDVVDARPLCIAAPLITHPEGLVKIASAGHFPTPSAMFAHYFGLYRLPRVRGHYLLLGENRPERTDVDWVSGACLMVSRTTWDAVDGLDERWFMYAEDIDFCWRVAELGGTAVMDAGASATHLVGASDSARSDAANSLWVENLYEFYALRMSPGRVRTTIWGLVVGTGLFVRSLVFTAQRRPRSAFEFRAHARAVFRRRTALTRNSDV